MTTRRDFLRCGAAAMGVGAVGVTATVPEPHVAFPTAAVARLAVASWPFRKQYSPRDGTVRLEHFPAMVASRFKVKGIEPLSDHFPATDDGYLDVFRKALEDSGTHVVNIPVNPHGSLYDPDAGKRMAAVAAAKRWVDVAVKIGSPSVRVSVTGPRGASPDEGRTIESLKAIADYGAYKNVVINVENDDPYSEEAFFLARVIDGVGTAWMRALPDFCNSMVAKRGDGEYNNSALKAMFARAYSISHVKDSEMDGPTIYRVSVQKCFEIAKAAGYRGYYSMEWEGRGEPYSGTEKLIKLSMAALGAAA